MIKFVLKNGSVVVLDRVTSNHVYVTEEGRGLPALSLYIPKEYVQRELRKDEQVKPTTTSKN